MRIAIDTSVVVGLINPRDLWHGTALNLRTALIDAGHEAVYFDCVAAEAISVITRRLHEKRLTAEIETLLDRLGMQTPKAIINWILPDVPRLYDDVLGLVRSTGGMLNFNDALIALACQERAIPAIASFDSDFDSVGWLRRVSEPDHLHA